MTDVNDYLAAIRANNPSLAKYWPGAKMTEIQPDEIQQVHVTDVTKMNDIDLAFEYRECKESGECGVRLNELEQETAKRVMAKGPPKAEEPVATSIKRGCLPCSSQHLVTCVGLLNEAMRFVRTEGVGSDQVLEDTNACLGELNALERVDMTPEKISQLPPGEKELALELLSLSRETRHALEGMRTPDDLEKIAANLQPKQREIFKKWVRSKLDTMSPQAKENLIKEAMEKIKKEGEHA
jgi:hypothetical protein